MHGWLPVVVQILAVVALVAAIGWRTRRWRLMWLPWSALIGVVLAVAAYWYDRLGGHGRRQQPCAARVVGLDRVVRARLRGAGVGLERGAVVAAQRSLCWRCRCACCRPALMVNTLGRLLPHRADRVESADRRAAAGPDRSGHGRRDAEANTPSPSRAACSRWTSQARPRVSSTDRNWCICHPRGFRAIPRLRCRRS